MLKNRSFLILILGALLAGHAGWGFLSGDHARQGGFETLVMTGQALAGLTLMAWAIRTRRPSSNR